MDRKEKNLKVAFFANFNIFFVVSVLPKLNFTDIFAAIIFIPKSIFPKNTYWYCLEKAIFRHFIKGRTFYWKPNIKFLETLNDQLSIFFKNLKRQNLKTCLIQTFLLHTFSLKHIIAIALSIWIFGKCLLSVIDLKLLRFMIKLFLKNSTAICITSKN